MWSMLRASIVVTLLSMAWSKSTPDDAAVFFAGSVRMLSDPSEAKCTGSTACTLCQAVCTNIWECMATADATVSTGGLDETSLSVYDYGFLKSTVCGNFLFQVSTPVEGPATISSVASAGALLVRPFTSQVRIEKKPETCFSDTDCVVKGSLVAQCDGMTMYLSPGDLCSCSADFVVDSGQVMGIDKGLPGYDTNQGNTPVKLGSIYGLRVKQNPSFEDFQTCNATFMGSHTEVNAGKSYGVQCFRNFIVAQSQVTRYNNSVCGTQLHFFNQGLYQNETTCRDGLGVVNDAGDGISSPAGVFSHRSPADFPVPAGTLDDSEWFFSLTPSKLPLNASAQLDMQLTLLTGPEENRTQLTCIAEYKVGTYTDNDAAVTYTEPILGLSSEPMKQPDSASTVAFAWAMLLPILFFMLM